MTFLSRREISRFRNLVTHQQWSEVAQLGERLLRKDPRDGMGIRYGVMDAYGVLGDDKKAEDLAIRYCDYGGDYWDETTYMSGAKVAKGWDAEQRATWMDTIETSLSFQFAMALWKGKRYEEAKRVLNAMPPFLKDYLELDEDDLEEEKARVDSQIGIYGGSIDELVGDIAIPYKDQVEFRKWAATVV